MNLSILTLILLTNLFLAGAVIPSVKESKISRQFLALIFAIIAWTVCNYLAEWYLVVKGDPTQSLLLTKATLTTSIVAVSIFLIFAANFPTSTTWWNNTNSVIVTIFGLIVGYLSLTSSFISGVSYENSIIKIHVGDQYYIFLLFLGVSLLLGLFLLFKKFLYLKGDQKLQAKYILIGVGFSALAAIITNAVLPAVMEQNNTSSYGPYFMIFFIIFATYAITKHGMFNLKIVIAEIATGGLVLVNVLQAVLSQNTAELIFRIIILTIVALAGAFLIGSVRNEIKKREEVEKLAKEKTTVLAQLEERNKNLATLQRISKLVLDEIELKSMAQKILDEIPKQLPNTVGALLNLVVGGNMKAYAMTQNELSTKLSELIGDDLEKFNYPIQESFNKLHATLISKEIQHSDTLSDFVSPPINKPVAVTAQKLLGIKHLVAIPMFSGKSPLGVILFAYKVPHTNLEAKELEMAQAIADDFSLAIQRAEAFQKLKDANEYLAQMDKMKDEFISIASHELNTPLAAVEGYLSMILDEGMGKVDAKAKEYLKRAYSSSRRLADLIMDLLNVSRIEQGRVKMKFTKNNLYDLADSVVKELQVKANAKKLKLTLEGKKSDVPETYCDPDRIREVFVNLVGNSIKYTEKGTIQVEIHGDHSKIVSEVTDTGRGISAQDQKKLFQKFSQVKREIDEHQGTGLGLYISKNFVEIHKGRIYVESEEGKGSTFAFELPIMKEPPKKVEGAILETNISAPQIEEGEKELPETVTGKKDS